MELTTGLAVVLFLIWFVIGFTSYIYWITRNYDFKKSDVYMAILSGLFGFISFMAALIVCLSEYKIKNDTVLFKKRH